MNPQTNTTRQNIRMFGVVALVILASVSLYFSFDTAARIEEKSPSTVERKNSPFKDLALTAKAAYVYDSRTGEVFFAQNENMRLPLASVTKVMAGLVAVETAMPNSMVVVDKESLLPFGDSGLKEGERWSLKDLLDFSLTSSSNDGMQAIALSIGAIGRSDSTPSEKEDNFVNKMNEKAEDIGMKNTYYFNVTGLDESNVQGGAYGTAKDMTLLFDHILRYQPSLLEATKESQFSVYSLDNLEHVAKNTGLNVTEIPGIRASKTGFTDIAGGNLVIAFDPELGRSIIVAVLGSTADERFADVSKLVDASLVYIGATD